MKRYIKLNQKIYGMAFSRSDALDKLHMCSATLVEHIVKCVIYRNSTDSLDHWVKEICNYFAAANKITVKPNDRKLKSSDYMVTVFASMGDSRIDAEYAILEFYARNEHTHEYPEFEVTEELVDSTFDAYNSIKDYMIPILTTNNNYKAMDFYPTIYNILR